MYEFGSRDILSCPECGRYVEDEDVRGFLCRGTIPLRLRRTAIVQAVLWGLLAIATGGVFRLCGAHWNVWPAAALIAAGLLAGSGWSGCVAARAAMAADRRGYRLIWLRTHLVLNAGWILAIVITPAYVFVESSVLPERFWNMSRVVVFACWGFSQLIIQGAWGYWFDQERLALHLNAERAWPVYGWLSAAIGVVSLMAGFFAMGVLVISLAHWR